MTWQDQSNPNRASVSTDGNCWHPRRLLSYGRTLRPVAEAAKVPPIPAEAASEATIPASDVRSLECLRRDRSRKLRKLPREI